jgi:hypothetical protein
VLKEKEDPMVEEVPTETPSGDHRKIAMDVDVAKIASKNLTPSEGRDTAETIASVTHDDVATLSSRGTEEALELLFSSPPRDPVSHVLEPSYNFSNDQLDDWSKANDTAASVYVALTIDGSSSHISTVNAPCDK